MAKAKQPGVWGIEIGQCAFKALRLEMIGGKVTATAFDYIEHPKILSQPDADPDQLTREALAKFLERNPLRGDTVVIGVPGQSGLARFVKLPPVEEKKISDIVRFEAKQQIPFPLEEVIWDFQKIGSGVVTDGFAMETEIGLFAMKKDMIQRFLQHFLEVNVEVHIIQMAPLALCNYIAYDLLKQGGPEPAEGGADAKSTAVKGAADTSFKKKCVVVLDIGTDSSNLVITDSDRIIWQRPIPKGGNHFTRALTKDLKLTFAKAEHLKRNATKSPDLKRILAALKPELNEFVGEVQRSLGYFTNTHRDAHVEYMMGLGNAFRLPGLQKFLSEKLQIDVRKLQKLERLSGENVLTAPAFTNNVLSFATVYGLALQGLKITHLRTNLLPPEIHVARMVKAKKPWAVAAAASLLLGLAATMAGYTLQYRAVAGTEVKQAMKKADDLAQKVEKFETDFRAAEGRVKENEDSVKAIIAGQDERLNWILLNRFVNDCLPVPALRLDGKVQSIKDGKSCTLVDHAGKVHDVPLDKWASVLVSGKYASVLDLKEGQEAAIVYQLDKGGRKYWEAQPAKDAFLSYWTRQAGDKGDSKADDEGVEDLIQVNVESVSALYANDLGAFFEAVKKKKDFADGMPNRKEAAGDGPEGKGWVVEVRGYTYNRARRQFVMDTLVENLATKAVKAVAAAAPPAAAAPAAAVPPDKPEGDKDKAEKKDPDKEKKDADKAREEQFDKVIANRVSHVILYEYKAVPQPDPTKFALIGASALPHVVNTGSSSWKTLLSESGSGGADKGEKGGAEKSTGGSGASKDKDKDKETEKKGPSRTEFIILFVWIEPTPSDDRMEARSDGPTGGTRPRRPR